MKTHLQLTKKVRIGPFWREQRVYLVGPATEGNHKIEVGQTDLALTRQHPVNPVGCVSIS
jgi:hypothetical protein